MLREKIKEVEIMKKYLIVFLISMVPLIELRGAIPYAVLYKLNMPTSYIVAIIGNMLPVPIIFFFARKVLLWGKDKPVIGKFFTFCLTKGEHGGEKLIELVLGLHDDGGNRCFCLRRFGFGNVYHRPRRGGWLGLNRCNDFAFEEFAQLVL